MNGLSSWITTVFLSAFICAICEFFISDSKFCSLIKGILGVFFLVNLLIPLKNIKISKADLHFQEYNQKLDSQIDKRIEILAKEKIRKKILDFLHRNGIKEKNIIIHINKTRASCDISFEKGVEDKKSIIKNLKKEFGIDFYLKN